MQSAHSDDDEEEAKSEFKSRKTVLHNKSLFLLITQAINTFFFLLAMLARSFYTFERIEKNENAIFVLCMRNIKACRLSKIYSALNNVLVLSLAQ